MTDKATADVLFIWAAPQRDESPDRLAVKICARCGSLVPTGDADATHSRWHRQVTER